MEVGGHMGGGVLKCVTCLQILLFLNKSPIIHFCRWRGWNTGHGGLRDHKISHFCGRHKCMTPKRFKITTNSIIRGSSFLFNIKPQARYILTTQTREQLPSSSPHTDGQTKVSVIFSWHLIF